MYNQDQALIYDPSASYPNYAQLALLCLGLWPGSTSWQEWVMEDIHFLRDQKEKEKEGKDHDPTSSI